MSSELPEPWGSVLGPKGVHSYRDLGARSGFNHQTAWRLVNGGGTSQGTLRKVAVEFFDGDVNYVLRLRGSAAVDHGEWSLPAEASLLTEEQRAAILAVVRAMLPVETRQRQESTDGTPIVEQKPERPTRERASRGTAKSKAKHQRRTENPETTQSPDAGEPDASGKSA